MIKDLNFGMTKRQKIVLATLVVTFFWILSSSSSLLVFSSYKLLLALAVATYLISLWALWEKMTRLKSVILLILPLFYAISAPLFYVVGKQIWDINWTSRLPWAIFFGISFYGLLLSQNVFHVASERTIPLYRAASTAAFFYTLITAFFVYNVVYALQLPFFLNFILVALVSFPLIMQFLWDIEMEEINPRLIVYSSVLALMVGELSLSFSFWPLTPFMWSAALSAAFYVLVGIMVEHLRSNLGKSIVMEYAGVGGIVLLFALLVTSWAG